MMPDFASHRRLAAEFVGTLALVATVVGSGIMATSLTSDAGLQLLANALATAAILVVLITIFGPVSGAHFNPAVSLVFASRGELPVRELPGFIVVQCLGGIAGTALAHTMFGRPLLEAGVTARTGLPLWTSEFVAAFLLVLAILGAIRWRKDMVAVIVALTILAAYWFTASTSFANPAVTLARSFTTSFSGIRLMDVPMFTIMQCAGAMSASVAASYFFGEDKGS
jgi:glycerol uptake facilitator-like aquaporin